MNKNIKYAGFWIRAFASIIDSLVLGIPMILVFLVIFGANIEIIQEETLSTSFQLLEKLLFMLVTIVLWLKWGGKTPGKALLGIRIVNGDNMGDLTPKQAILRYIGYFVSIFILFIGFFMIAFRKDKRGLHDMIANTYVIYIDNIKNESLEEE